MTTPADTIGPGTAHSIQITHEGPCFPAELLRLQTLSTREYPIPCPLSSQHQHHCWVLAPTLVKFHCFDTTLTSHMLTSNPPARGLPQPLRLYFPTTYSITQTLPDAIPSPKLQQNTQAQIQSTTVKRTTISLLGCIVCSTT